jgi:hypothetical protein
VFHILCKSAEQSRFILCCLVDSRLEQRYTSYIFRRTHRDKPILRAECIKFYG